MTAGGCVRLEEELYVCLVHLYTLEGAITNTGFNCLSEEKKKELKEVFCELYTEWRC